MYPISFSCVAYFLILYGNKSRKLSIKFKNKIYNEKEVVPDKFTAFVLNFFVWMSYLLVCQYGL